MDFLIRFVQVHEEFRRAEIEALAAIAGVVVQVVSYSNKVRWNSAPANCNARDPWDAALCSHTLSNNQSI